MGSIERAIFLFLPAALDIVFAALDFFIFTSSAHEDNVLLRQTILERDDIWCVTVSQQTTHDHYGGRQFVNGAAPSPKTYDGRSPHSLVVPAVSFLCILLSRRFLKTPSSKRRETYPAPQNAKPKTGGTMGAKMMTSCSSTIQGAQDCRASEAAGGAAGRVANGAAGGASGRVPRGAMSPTCVKYREMPTTVPSTSPSSRLAR